LSGVVSLTLVPHNETDTCNLTSAAGLGIAVYIREGLYLSLFKAQHYVNVLCVKSVVQNQFTDLL